MRYLNSFYLKAQSLLEEEENAESSGSASPWSNFWSKVRTLLPFVWPKKTPSLQIRVLFCFLLLGAGRVANVYVPVLYKMLGEKFIDLILIIIQNLTIYFPTPVDSMTPAEGNDIIFRWDLVLIYVGVKFLQGGGMGGVGFLNNLRSFLWISVQQYTTRETEVR